MAYDSIQLQNAMQQIPMAYQQPYAAQDTARYAAQDTTGYAAQQAPINFGAGAQVEEKKSGLSLGKVVGIAGLVIAGVATHKGVKLNSIIKEAQTAGHITKEAKVPGLLESVGRNLNPLNWFNNKAALEKIGAEGSGLTKIGESGKLFKNAEGEVIIFNHKKDIFKAETGEADDVVTKFLNKTDEVKSEEAVATQGGKILKNTVPPKFNEQEKVMVKKCLSLTEGKPASELKNMKEIELSLPYTEEQKSIIGRTYDIAIRKAEQAELKAASKKAPVAEAVKGNGAFRAYSAEEKQEILKFLKDSKNVPSEQLIAEKARMLQPGSAFDQNKTKAIYDILIPRALRREAEAAKLAQENTPSISSTAYLDKISENIGRS